MAKEAARTDGKALGSYLSTNYSQIQGIIKQADTKANIVIGLTGVILSMFFTTFKATDALTPWQITLTLCVFFSAGLCALITLYPRMARASGKFSLSYYKDAMNVDATEWAKRFMTRDEEELIVRDSIANIAVVSAIADRKYFYLRWSYILLGLGIFLKIAFEFWAGVLL